MATDAYAKNITGKITFILTTLQGLIFKYTNNAQIEFKIIVFAHFLHLYENTI